jgi:hypothetical protein
MKNADDLEPGLVPIEGACPRAPRSPAGGFGDGRVTSKGPQPTLVAAVERMHFSCEGDPLVPPSW